MKLPVGGAQIVFEGFGKADEPRGRALGRGGKRFFILLVGNGDGRSCFRCGDVRFAKSFFKLFLD